MTDIAVWFIISVNDHFCITSCLIQKCHPPPKETLINNCWLIIVCQNESKVEYYFLFLSICREGFKICVLYSLWSFQTRWDVTATVYIAFEAFKFLVCNSELTVTSEGSLDVSCVTHQPLLLCDVSLLGFFLSGRAHPFLLSLWCLFFFCCTSGLLKSLHPHCCVCFSS